MALLSVLSEMGHFIRMHRLPRCARHGSGLPSAAMGEKQHGRPWELTADSLPLKLLAVVWLPFSCGYFLSYAFRTINAIISRDLVRDLGLARTTGPTHGGIFLHFRAGTDSLA